MKNRITKLLNIEYPIIQGAMIEISLSDLVIAVSEAGGLGTLGQRGDIGLWHEEMQKIKALTKNPFAVNLGMYLGDIKERLDIILKENIKIVITSGGNPKPVLGILKEAGVTLMHVVSNSKQAMAMEKIGVDAVIAEGGESGGLVSKNIISTLVLVPAVVDAVSIPVIAAGGIADARGVVAAFALGAEGVQMGTIFEASEESAASADWKEGILMAKEYDIVVNDEGGIHARVITESVKPGNIITGQAAGLVNSIQKAGYIVRSIVDNIPEVLRRIQ